MKGNGDNQRFYLLPQRQFSHMRWKLVRGSMMQVVIHLEEKSFVEINAKCAHDL